MTNIFVAKLDFGVSDETLRELFENHGTVVKCQIAKDRETGKPRGFAFVEMSTPDEAQAAIRALDDHTINGRAMVVKIAEDRSASKGSAPRPRENQGDFNRTSRSESSAPASSPGNDFKVPFSKSDDFESSDTPVEKGPKRGPIKKKTPDKPESREFKMSAYKKSGKKNRIEMDDDDDWELEYRKSQKNGWDDDDSEE